MNINIHKSAFLSVKEQIKRQIRASINNGQMAPGDALYSANDLSTIIDVNRNTVASAYKELVEENLLISVVGKGTFVKEGNVPVLTNELNPIIDEVFSKAKSLGFTVDQIADSFLNRLTSYTASIKPKVLVIWCNKDTISDIRKALENELNVDTEGVMLQKLEENPKLVASYFSDIDLIVCGIDFLESVNSIAQKYKVEVVGIMLAPITRMMNEILRLPKGSTVGFSCVNDIESESFSKNRRLSTGSTLKTIWAGADDSERLHTMIEQCDLIFATNYVFEKIRKLAHPDKRVINIDVTSIDNTNMSIIKEALNKM
ncbi:MAG: GntR family transcriptional regulator [Desulfobacterales bacterium]|nr:GntR family transcriptional regulator [Desulfobacterales bacterium]